MEQSQIADEQSQRAGKLAGRVALITGAAGAGIGQAVARRFAEEGAEVVVTDAHAARVAEVAETMSADYGREVAGVQVDVREQDQVDAALREALDRHGRVDILFNNAGINKLQPIWEIDDESWALVQGVCLEGTFRCIRAVLPTMIEQGS